MARNVYMGRKQEIRKRDFKGGGKCLIGDPEVWMEDEEENPTREENQEGHERLSVEPRKTTIEPSGDDNHVKENHEDFSLEAREIEDVGIQNGFETIQVEMKEKVGERGAKDGNACLFGKKKSRNMILSVKRNV